MANFERKELVLIRGKDASDMTDDEIFQVIKAINDEIDTRKMTAFQSAKQQDKVQSLRDDVDAIVDYVDKRDVKS